MADKQKIVVISDIHIGDNSETCWYRREYHEAYFIHLLDWIIDNRADIRELIILGDLFDFWTYPPFKSPPKIEKIIAANENVLGPEGKLGQVLTALEGNVTYLNGNHDMNVTQVHLNKIYDAKHPNYRIRIASSDPYLPDGPHWMHQRLVFTHGHEFTMFNAPDHKSSTEYINLRPLPVGHFVTRIIAYFLDKSGESAADLHDQGVPDDLYVNVLEDVRDKIELGDYEGLRPEAILLDALIDRTEIPTDTPIVLPDGAGLITLHQVKETYRELWQNWVDVYGEVGAYKAMQADHDGSYLGWFAQKLSMEFGNKSSRLPTLNSECYVVMGHTHIPRWGLIAQSNFTKLPSKCHYANLGFTCPAKPDMDKDKAHFSFGVVEPKDLEHPDHSDPSIQLFKVVPYNGQLVFNRLSTPAAPIVFQPSEDYSCYVQIQNTSGGPIRLSNSYAKYGHFIVNPPEVIPNYGRGFCWIQDKGFWNSLRHLDLSGAAGTQGHVVYKTVDGQDVVLDFQCVSAPVPYFNENSCSGADYWTRAGDSSSSYSSEIKQGNPFWINFSL